MLQLRFSTKYSFIKKHVCCSNLLSEGNRLVNFQREGKQQLRLKAYFFTIAYDFLPGLQYTTAV